MKRKLAKEALWSPKQNLRPFYSDRQQGPDDIPAMQNFTKKRAEEIDPGGLRARALLLEVRAMSRSKQ